MASRWETVIGLEVHAQLRTRTKAFCSCATNVDAPPNTNTCPVCLGMPGALPSFGHETLRLALRAGLALGCTIHERSRFARKNYFYPDLPKGYQISQYDEPLCEGGALEFLLAGERRTVRLTRLHLEEDAGKSRHDGERSLIDFNRCGVPLIEIVSEPELRSPEEASAYLKELRRVLQYTGVCDGNMEEGSFRCDANLSLRPAGETAFGTRTELKNLNSFRHVQRALAFEAARQQEILESGGAIRQETRLWDPATGRTRSMRGKEEAHDYRYFPEPDLPPLELPAGLVAQVREELPELPGPRRERFAKDYGLRPEDAALLTDRAELADYYEEVVRACENPRRATSWVSVELLGALRKEGRGIATCPLPPATLGRLVTLVEAGTLSGRMAKEHFGEILAGETDPDALAARAGGPVTDEGALGAHIDTVLDAHPDKVLRYRAGKKKLMGFFVGQVMQATGGRAEPRRAERTATPATGRMIMTQDKSFETIVWREDAVVMLDQLRLPHEEVYERFESPEAVAEAIRRMVIRGAPRDRHRRRDGDGARHPDEQRSRHLGSAGGHGRRRGAHGGHPPDGRQPLLGHRADAPGRGRQRDPASGGLPGSHARGGPAILDEDIAANRAIGRYGAELLPATGTVLTHCNAGALATGGYGTALGVIRAAVEAGKKLRGLRRRDPPLPPGRASDRLGAHEGRHRHDGDHRQHGRLAHAPGRDRRRRGRLRPDHRQRGRRQQDRHLRAVRTLPRERCALLRRRADLDGGHESTARRRHRDRRA